MGGIRENPSEQNVEIEGTEPYIVGGHTASGYWVDTERETTIHGLYAAGDVAGGCPQKYVTGALVEGEIAAHSIVQKLDEENETDPAASDEENVLDNKIAEYDAFLTKQSPAFTVEELEEAMQKSWISMPEELEPIISSTKSSLPWQKKNQADPDSCQRPCGIRYA